MCMFLPGIPVYHSSPLGSVVRNFTTNCSYPQNLLPEAKRDDVHNLLCTENIQGKFEQRPKKI